MSPFTSNVDLLGLTASRQNVGGMNRAQLRDIGLVDASPRAKPLLTRGLAAFGGFLR